MKITFLGTGTSQGIPLIGCECKVCTSADSRDKRLRTSVMIENEGTRIVIDTGPDFRQQMLREKVNSLDGILFTHEHKDHISGLDDVRAFNYILKRKMDVYATGNVISAIKREFAYIFSEFKYPGIPQLNIHEINLDPFKIGSLEIIPIQVFHLNLPVLGFRIGNFTYITDANRIEPEEMKKITGSEILVLNALRREKHVSHFTLDEAIEIVKLVKPAKAFFTHISHQLGLHQEVAGELPPNVFLAHDGLTLSI